MAKGISSKLIAAESVTEGHPDKLCDQIADAILDEHLAQDPLARVGCEVMAAKNLIIIAGEISSTARVDCASIARRILIERGYVDQSIGIDGNSCEILLSLSQQSKT